MIWIQWHSEIRIPFFEPVIRFSNDKIKARCDHLVVNTLTCFEHIPDAQLIHAAMVKCWFYCSIDPRQGNQAKVLIFIESKMLMSIVMVLKAVSKSLSVLDTARAQALLFASTMRFGLQYQSRNASLLAEREELEWMMNGWRVKSKGAMIWLGHGKGWTASEFQIWLWTASPWLYHHHFYQALTLLLPRSNIKNQQNDRPPHLDYGSRTLLIIWRSCQWKSRPPKHPVAWCSSSEVRPLTEKGVLHPILMWELT